jgi:hypothetical protein
VNDENLPVDGVVEMHTEDLDLLSFCGIFKPAVRGVKLEDMEEAIREGAIESVIALDTHVLSPSRGIAGNAPF